jgi:hypothetical protein
MILAIIRPYYFPSVRGNSVTVQRIASGLRDRGLMVQVFSLDQQDPDAILAGLRGLRPHLVHGFHATATGPLQAEAGKDLSIPTVVTLTGTDVNHDLFDPALRSAMGQRARQKIETHFPLEGEIGGYLALYRSLAAGRGV